MGIDEPLDLWNHLIASESSPCGLLVMFQTLESASVAKTNHHIPVTFIAHRPSGPEDQGGPDPVSGEGRPLGLQSANFFPVSSNVHERDHVSCLLMTNLVMSTVHA